MSKYELKNFVVISTGHWLYIARDEEKLYIRVDQTLMHN
jgi:hypothetical protein